MHPPRPLHSPAHAQHHGQEFLRQLARRRDVQSEVHRLAKGAPGNAKYERNEDSERIEIWLANRGFILGPEAEGDGDEEAPSAVLESA